MQVDTNQQPLNLLPSSYTERTRHNISGTNASMRGCLQRAVVPVRRRFAWCSLVGFVHPASGRTIFHLATSVSSALFEVELVPFARQVFLVGVGIPGAVVYGYRKGARLRWGGPRTPVKVRRTYSL